MGRLTMALALRCPQLGWLGAVWLMGALSVQTTAPRQLFVAAGGSGDGSSAAPFGSIQHALDAAAPGDTINVLAGTYRERITSRRQGTAVAPITIRAPAGRGSVIVTVAGEVAQIDHAYHVVDGLVFDAQYARADAIDINTPASAFILRNAEVRHATNDCIDIGGPASVLIENAVIHHCLNADDGRTDAHGIAAGAVRDLTVRHTEIHTFSGDAFQLDPDRSAPGWDRVTVEGCRFWLAPLSAPANGFAQGAVPGENAIDTKTMAGAPRARLVVRDTVAFGFRDGLLANMAAFNLKERIDALLDGVSVYDSDIAFRARGSAAGAGAWVRVQNAVVYDVNRAIRYEDDIARLQVFNSTIGLRVARPFDAAGARNAGLDVRNLLLVADDKPGEAAGASNLAVTPADFVDPEAGDYRLRSRSKAIDAGVAIEGATTDRTGSPRPKGRAFDVGAFEFAAGRQR